jgi:hypothetical protein
MPFPASGETQRALPSPLRRFRRAGHSRVAPRLFGVKRMVADSAPPPDWDSRGEQNPSCFWADKQVCRGRPRTRISEIRGWRRAPTLKRLTLGHSRVKPSPRSQALLLTPQLKVASKARVSSLDILRFSAICSASLCRISRFCKRSSRSRCLKMEMSFSPLISSAPTSSFP